MQARFAANRLLASLSTREARAIRPLLEPEHFELGSTLWEYLEPVDRVVFPLDTVISSVTTMSNNTSIEGLLIGGEGIVGGAALFGVPTSPWRTTVQATGDALTAYPDVLADRLGDLPSLRRGIARFDQAAKYQATQSVACNRFHTVRERLARWLLMLTDRTASGDLEVTHAFLAELLGIHRPSASVEIAALQAGGALCSGGRGHLIIVERAQLEAESCECYRRVSDYVENTFA